MITALIVLVFAVLVAGWVLAGIAFVASFVSIIPRLRDRSVMSCEDSASLPAEWRAGDDKFLHDVGIRP